MSPRFAQLAIVLALGACGAAPSASQSSATRPFTVGEAATFDSPWAMDFLPGSGVRLTNSALVTEKAGKLWLVDVANGGCASFVHMLQLARQILTSTSARTALVCNAQNAAGRLFTQPGVRRLAQSAVPGDGCGVGFLTTSAASPLLAVETRHVPGHAGEMTMVCDDGRRYWQPGQAPLRMGFTADSVAAVLERGNRLAAIAHGHHPDVFVGKRQLDDALNRHAVVGKQECMRHLGDIG